MSSFWLELLKGFRLGKARVLDRASVGGAGPEVTLMKIHLFTSDNPPHEGVDVKAICGEQVSKVRLAFIFDVEFEGAANLNRLSICPKCYSTLSRARYICGAVNGQEAMTA